MLASIKQNEFAGEIGVSRLTINPPMGIYARTWGSATHDVAQGIHKPLYATCAAFSGAADERPVFLLALDLLFWRSKEDEQEIRVPLLKAFNLKDCELIVHLSHTHGAPSTDTEKSLEKGGEFIADYRHSINEACHLTLEEAAKNREPSTLTWATGSCRLANNRELRHPESGDILCGVNPSGHADDTLLVGRIADASGKIRATLVNYACHPTSLGGGNKYISPDYIGALREIVERETGGAICVFLHGADGDLTPRRSFEDDVGVADQNGREIGYAALSALTSMFPPESELAFEGREESGTALAKWKVAPAAASRVLEIHQETVTLNTKDLPSIAELREALKTCPNTYQRERVERRLGLREKIADNKSIDMPLYIWRLGASVLVGAPVEFYSAFQEELRRTFPGLTIAVLNICNGYLSYLPSKEAYEKDVYPVRVALFEAGSMEKVLDKTIEVISEFVI